MSVRIGTSSFSGIRFLLSSLLRLLPQEEIIRERVSNIKKVNLIMKGIVEIINIAMIFKLPY
jgi:hypothetical protein